MYVHSTRMPRQMAKISCKFKVIMKLKISFYRIDIHVPLLYPVVRGLVVKNLEILMSLSSLSL